MRADAGFGDRRGEVLQKGLNMDESKPADMTPEEKKRKLFFEQKKTLDLFLEKGAISRAQYEKSYGDLKLKMGFSDLTET
mgnify:CR=1 FL=1